MTLEPDQAMTPLGRLVSPATSLFERPFGCTLLFPPDADLTQLEAVVRSVGGRGLVLATAEDGWRRLELRTEKQFLPVLDRYLVPVLAEELPQFAALKELWARAIVRVTASGEIVLTALQLLPNWPGRLMMAVAHSRTR